jgi:hypothetical protein
MATSDDAFRVLQSIDTTLKALLALSQQRQAAARGPAIASDRDLDGQWGDPELKFMPRDWTGPSYKGRRFSACPPDLLDLAAETFEYFARQADEKNERTEKGRPVSEYKRADAARARGWAKRMRDGKHTPPPAPQGEEWANGNNDDIGF